MDILDIAAGVTLGGILTGMFWLCARSADQHEDWSKVPAMTSVGFIVPLGFVALVLFLEAQKPPGNAPHDAQARQSVHVQPQK